MAINCFQIRKYFILLKSNPKQSAVDKCSLVMLVLDKPKQLKVLYHSLALTLTLVAQGALSFPSPNPDSHGSRCFIIP